MTRRQMIWENTQAAEYNKYMEGQRLRMQNKGKGFMDISEQDLREL